MDENRSTPITIRIFYSLISTFVLVSFIWVIWGFLNPGDYFGNNGYLLLLELILAIPIGGIFGYFISPNKTVRYVLIFLTIIAIAFWIFVPDGWWAHEPPRPPSQLLQK
jgi:hypothetical protein